MEYREFRAGAAQADDNGKLSGLLAPFNSETIIGRLDRGGWREEIAPGAFTKTIKEGDTVLLCDHDMSKPLARVSAETLRLRETEQGLEFDADPADTSYYRDLRVNIKARNKGGMSIGFDPIKDDWFDDDGNPASRMTGTRRILREVRLPEGSCVTNPAYKGTTVSARDDANALLEARQRAAEQETEEREAEEREDESRDEIVAFLVEEERAADINTAGRKALAAKGQALPDGSYPIPDKSHLHAAAVLAASGHGDVAAAKRLIRKRAKELGVDVTTLPGFGKESKADADTAEGRDDPDGKEYEVIDRALRLLRKSPPDVKGALGALRERQGQRDDPDGREFAAIDKAIRLLEENPPDVKGAKMYLSDNQMMRRDDDATSGESRGQEPDASTPEDDEDLALSMVMAQDLMRSSEFGVV